MPTQLSDASGTPFLQPSLPDSDESRCGKPDWVGDIGDDALSRVDAVYRVGLSRARNSTPRFVDSTLQHV